MIAYTDQFPPITVVVPSSSLGRFVTFELSVEGLFVPSGTHMFRAMSANIALNCNEAVRLNPDSKFYWFIDDDHQFDQYTLLRLMAHDVPVVVPVTCLKDPPFMPVLYKSEELDKPVEHYDDLAVELNDLANEFADSGYDAGGTGKALLHLKALIERGPKQRATKKFYAYGWSELDKASGLIDVHACGRSGMLIRRDVFDKIPPPWFELGRTNPEYAGEDVFFCEKLRAAGIPIKADVDLTFGHISPVTAWPVRMEDGRWIIKLVWANGQSVFISRPGGTPEPAASTRDHRGNKVAQRMAELVAEGKNETEAFEQAMAESEAEERK